MTEVLSALLPPVVVGGAFLAVVVAVKRFAEREERAERAREETPRDE